MSSDSKSLSYESGGYFAAESLATALRKRALKGATVSLIAQGVNVCTSTIGTILLARLLTPHDFGLVTMVLSISLLLSNFGGNGFIEAIIQKDTISHSQISTLFWVNVAISSILTVLFMASAPAIAWFYREPLLKPIVIVMAVSILFSGLSNQHQALLRRGMDFVKTSLIDVIATIVSLIISLYLATRGWGYWAVAARWIFAPLLVTIGVWILCNWRPGLPSRGSGIRPMLKFATNTYGNFAANYFRRNLDKVLIGRFLGSQSLGIYDRPYQLSQMLQSQLLNPINSVALSAFSRVTGDREKYRRHYLDVLSTIAFVCMPLSAAMTLAGRDLISLLLGPQWGASRAIFLAFGLSMGVEILYQTHPWLHLSLGTPDRWFRWSIVAVAISSVCFAAGLFFGSFGVAVAFSISNYVLLLPGLCYAGRPVNIGISSIISAIKTYVCAAVAAGLLCWFFLYSWAWISAPFLRLNIVLRILLSGSLCLSLYLGLIASVFRDKRSISQFVSILRDTVRR